MPQPIYLQPKQDAWSQYLPMVETLMRFGMIKMKNNLELANQEKIHNIEYKNFEKEQTFKQQTELGTEQGKRDIRSQDVAGSLEEVPVGADTSKLTNITKINGKDYFLPHGTRYDAGTQSLENLPEAKVPPKAEVAEFNGKKYELYHENGRLVVGKELGDAKSKWEPTTKEEAIEVRRSGQKTDKPDKINYQPTNVTYKDGTTGTANFNPKNGKYFDPATKKDITGEINVRGLPKEKKPSWTDSIMGGATNKVAPAGNQPKIDTTSLRNDLIKNGYTEQEADDYIKRAKKARKL